MFVLCPIAAGSILQVDDFESELDNILAGVEDRKDVLLDLFINEEVIDVEGVAFDGPVDD